MSGYDFVRKPTGDNQIDVGDGGSKIITGDGDDIITAGDGWDHVNAGGGDNTVSVGNGGSKITTGDGNDVITAEDGWDHVRAGGGNNAVDVGDGGSSIRTGKGDDNIRAGDGWDLVRAGGGDNTVDVGDGGSIIITGKGDDNIRAGDGWDYVRAGDGDNTVDIGGGGGSVKTGRGTDDITVENTGFTHVRSGAGDDQVTYMVVDGARGYGHLKGESGTDTLVLGLPLELYKSQAFQSQVADFLANKAPTGAAYFFKSLNLRVEGFENVRVMVDGIELDPIDQDVAAQDDTAQVEEDDGAVLLSSVLLNDSVPNGVAAVELVSGPAKGIVDLMPDGTYTFNPNGEFEDLGAGETETVSFTYRVGDLDGDASEATATITIHGNNDAPVAADDMATTDEDVAIDGNVLANDGDIEGDGLTASLVSNVSNGTLNLNPDGTYSYAPDADFNGTDSFVYEVDDGNGGTDRATVTININAVNDGPAAADDSAAGDEDTLITGDVLANDVDVDGDLLTATVVTDVANGILALKGDGTFDYQPDRDFNGTDSFVYEVDDGNGGTDRATVTININAVNDGPAAADDSVAGDEDTLITGDVLANDVDVDGDLLTATVVTDVANGILALKGDGTFDYQPDRDFNGTDSFVYEVDDGNGGIDRATVTININAVNDGPAAADDSVAGDEDTLITGDVLANDVDVDGDLLTATVVTDVANGILALNGDGTFGYRPDRDFNGTDSFVYEVDDGNGGIDGATVTITVNATNDAPVARNDSFSGDEDTVITGNVLLNDSDPDGDALTVTAFGIDASDQGRLSLGTDGSFTFTPVADYNGTFVFLYDISDGNGGVDTASATLHVNPVEDPPQAVDDSFSGDEDTVITGSVLSNDTDPDGDALSATPLTGPSNGNLELSSNGLFVYTPFADFNGTEVFEYQVSDGNGGTDIATVTITVNAVNDAPEAGPNIGQKVATEEQFFSFTLPDDAFFDIDTADLIVTATLFDGGPLPAWLSFDGQTFSGTPDDGDENASVRIIADDGEFQAQQSLLIGILQVNDAPSAADDWFVTEETLPVSDNLFDENGGGTDSDADGDVLAVTAVDGDEFAVGTQITLASGALLTVAGDGTFEYDPNGAFSYLFLGEPATDGFSYTISDGNGATDSADVTINIIGDVNQPPMAETDIFEVLENRTVTIAPLANDTDDFGEVLTIFAIDGQPIGDGETVTLADGAEVTLNLDGTITYDPNGAYDPFPGGLEFTSFTYGVRDASGNVNTGWVSGLIRGNEAPEPLGDVAQVLENETVIIDPLANDSDPEGDPLTIVRVDGFDITVGETIDLFIGGQITLLPDGTLLYDPNGNINPEPGQSLFVPISYEVSDTAGNVSLGTIGVTVLPNEPPVVGADSISVVERGSVAVELLANDSDPEGDALTLINVNGLPIPVGETVFLPEGAKLFRDDVDTFIFSADPSLDVAPGNPVSNQFTYEIQDGAGNATIGIVDYEIIADQPPIVGDDAVSVLESASITFDPLANDSDPEGRELFVFEIEGQIAAPLSLIILNSGAWLTVNSDDTLTYNPIGAVNPSQGIPIIDDFTYGAADPFGNVTQGTIAVTVIPVNEAPTAIPDTVTTDEDTQITFDIRANDIDPDGDPLTVTLLSSVSNGSLLRNPDNTLTYTPNADFNGPDSFSYLLEDGQGGSDSTVVNIVVDPVNDAPVANADVVTTDEDAEVTFNILVNDSDPEGRPLTVTVLSSVSQGSLVQNPDDTFTYTPNVDFNGSDSFTYGIEDGDGGADSAVVDITVTPVNDAPVATPDAATTNEDTAVTFNVLDNDTDPDGDSPIALLVSSTSNGTIILGANGVATYAPDPDFNGIDSFTYKANDGVEDSGLVTVSVTVEPVNDAPVAADDAFSGDEDTVIGGNVLANDSDIEGNALSATPVNDVSNGALVLNPDGSFSYTPDANFFGTDSFVYRANDGNGGEDEATVTITVNPVNDPVSATGDSATTDEDTPVVIDVLANDGDADGAGLIVTHINGLAVFASSEVTLASGGLATLEPNGSVTYLPPADFNGLDTFTYTMTDGSTTETATVSVTVNPVNDAPVANNDTATTEEATRVTIDVLANDTDADGDALTVINAFASDGIASVAPDGSALTYTPLFGFVGTDTITYSISDDSATSGGTVSVTVNAPVNNPPVAADDTARVFDGESVSILADLLLRNDRDPDPFDRLTIDPDSLIANLGGSVELVTDDLRGRDTIVFTHDGGRTSDQGFYYTVEDGNGGSDTAFVDITVDSSRGGGGDTGGGKGGDDPGGGKGGIDPVDPPILDPPIILDPPVQLFDDGLLL